MERKLFLFSVVVGLILILVIMIDRWGQKTFVSFILTSVAPLKDPLHPPKSPVLKRTTKTSTVFPEKFLIGTSSSAYQIEGAWNESGKSPSIWDDFVHFYPHSVDDNTTGDVGPDSFHNYQEDVRALKLVGFHHYRFSISWTRIIPYGSTINQHGIDYYEKLIDELIANNIEPMVTLFHWDVPRWLQDLGGLANPLFVEYFREFADVLFQRYGSKVKTWMTINEPFNYCTNGYNKANWAPAIKSPGIGEYLCGHHILLAHAAVFHLYKEKYFEQQQGSIGITLDSRYYYPMNSGVTENDLQRAQEYRLGWFSHPLFSKEGGYPKVMVDEIAARSKLEGRPNSRLPEMDEATKAYVRGTSDFFGLNYYTSRLLDVEREERDLKETPAWFKDAKGTIHIDQSWKEAKSTWLFSVPQGLRHLLVWIKDQYNNPPVLICENGWSDEGELEDDGRIEYIRDHINATLQAVYEDGCNVTGYTAWSLLDSFEWNRGFLEKFGIFSVNMTSPRRERTPKKSVSFLRKIIQDGSL